MLIEDLKGFFFTDWYSSLFKNASCDVTFNKFIMKARQRDWLQITDTYSVSTKDGGSGFNFKLNQFHFMQLVESVCSV